MEGCCHGELDKIYETLQYAQEKNNLKIDLLLICGDFQAVRNKHDLTSMAVPKKYQQLNTFYKYYSGEKVAPVLTVFIGGNHEASNYMQELPYGGWVAKNIYYMGYANVIQVGGLRIGGLSGIYKGRDYQRGHYEKPPYTDDSKRSVYHIRNLEVFRLKQLIRPVDIFMSHDWPRGITKYGDEKYLLKKKPFFKDDIDNNILGSMPASELLFKLKPSYWFSAHLHVKWAACVQHDDTGRCTKFLSLDKCLAGRDFLQILDIPNPDEGPIKISLDPEWLCILKTTNHLLRLNNANAYMPGRGGPENERYNFEVSDQDITDVQNVFGGNLTLPENFEPTAPTLHEASKASSDHLIYVNPQTSLICEMLDITHPNAIFTNSNSSDFLSAKIDMKSDSDETDDVPDEDYEDEMPSDINSSLDVSSSVLEISFIDSSFSMSDSFSSSKATGCSTPLLEVTDDDDELQSILVVQRQTSQKGEAASLFSDKGKQDSHLRLAEDSEAKELVPTCTASERLQEESDEFAIMMAAQKHKFERVLSDSEKSGSTSASQNKSSSELDYSSQESQDEGERSGTLARKVSGLEVCEGIDCSNASGSKRPSPNGTSSPGGSKKLKRRNVSMYSNGTEEDAS